MGAIKTSDLATSLGAYYRENRDVFAAEALDKFKTATHVEHYGEVVDELPLISIDTESVVQPYQKAFTPVADAIAFDGAQVLKVRTAKVDLELEPFEVLMKNWNGWMAKNKKKASEFPFEQFVIQYIAARINSDHEKIAWQGSYVAPTPGTAGAVATTAHGYKKLIADAITATSLTATATGAVTSANAVTKFELVYDALPDAVKAKGGKIFSSQTLYNAYAQHYRATYTSAPYNGEFGKRFLDLDPNWELVHVPGLAGSGRLIASANGNTVMGYNTDILKPELEFQNNRRVIDVISTYTMGFQFARFDHMAVNDQS